MPDHDVPGKKKQEKADQTRRTQGLKSQPMPKKLMAWDISSSLVGDTPFNSPMQRHAALLSRASPEQRVMIARQLQQTYGNRYVQRLVKSMPVQAKLTVGAADDPYEQEADRVAEKVVRAVDSQAQRKEEEELQAKPISDIQRQEEEEFQAKLDGGQPAAVFDDIEKRIEDKRGNGQPLPEIVRKPMQRVFDADFSGVRLHTDSEANALNKKLNAKAFTTRQDIFFRQGEYSPGSESGQKLIAHELTHTVQQGAVPLSPETGGAGTISEQRTARQTSKPGRRQLDWGSKAQSPEAASIESGWSAASSRAGKEISWAASEAAQTIAKPQQISWGASKDLAGAGGNAVILRKIEKPAPTTLDAIRAAWGKDTWAFAPFPTGFKVPSFDFNAKEMKGKGGVSQWVAAPALTKAADEGDSKSVYPSPGLYNRNKLEKSSKGTNVPTFVRISGPMSKLMYEAELEHANDYKWAYTISLKRAQYALTKGVVGKSVGPKPTKAAAEQMVLDTLGRYIHTDTGNIKTKWEGHYKKLYKESLIRDDKNWHTLPEGKAEEIKDVKGNITKMVYPVVLGPSKIGKVWPAQIIKY